MTRLLFTSTAAMLLVATFATPAQAQDPTEIVLRIGKLPGELIKAKKTDEEIVEALYLATIVRLPTEKEKEVMVKRFKEARDRKQLALDLAWALVNTKEFFKLHGLDKDLTSTLELMNRLTKEWEKEAKKEEK
ncbi:MAG: hypothetical protein L0241_10240 [Planctomycetia bacterium]|nr:hypothetical protein [Planctomycetia bacterium]